MKKLLLQIDRRNRSQFIGVLALIAALLVLFCGAGCESVPPGTTVGVNTPDGTNIVGTISVPLGTNTTLVVNGGGNTATGDWSAGVAIVFREEPPEFALLALREAGAQPLRIRSRPKEVVAVWVILNVDPTNAAHQRALALAGMVKSTQLKPFTAAP